MPWDRVWFLRYHFCPCWHSGPLNSENLEMETNGMEISQELLQNPEIIYILIFLFEKDPEIIEFSQREPFNQNYWKENQF